MGIQIVLYWLYIFVFISDYDSFCPPAPPCQLLLHVSVRLMTQLVCYQDFFLKTAPVSLSPGFNLQAQLVFLTLWTLVWEVSIWDVDTIVLVFLVGTASSPATETHLEVKDPSVITLLEQVQTTEWPAEKLTVLTLNQQLGGGRGPSAAVGRRHRIRPRILWEGLSDQQTVQVSVLQDPEVGRALDLGSLSVELHHRCGDTCHSDIQPHLAALPHGGALKSLKEVWRRRLRCTDTK